MEEPGEVEGEEIEEEPPKRGRRLVKILAVIIAAIVAGVGVWYFGFSNVPPVAEFTMTAVNSRLTVSAEHLSFDPDGTIQSYTWDWGDGTPAGSGVRAAHNYTTEKSYPVTLTVTDSRGATAATTKSVVIEILPLAFFIARHEGMTVSFDASGSLSDPGLGAITAYEWDFGDLTPTGTGVTATHTYLISGRYAVRLDVTAGGKTSSATRYVSPAATTVDVLADRFFEAGCPYVDHWTLRLAATGERALQNQAPCSYFYPWVLFTGDPDVNPSWIYTAYRFDVKVRNHPGYTLSEPVFWPAFNRSAALGPSSSVEFNLTLDYVGPEILNRFKGTVWEIPEGFGDGWATLLRGTITMDLEASRRIFGVDATTPTFSTTANPVIGQWTSPRNGFSSDNLYATASVNGYTSQYGSYGVSQLGGSPSKVEVGLEGKADGDDGVLVEFSTDGGATWTPAGTVNLGTTDTTTFFDVTTLRSWTFSLLSNPNFRTRIVYVQVGTTANVTSVDWVPVRVTSSVPAAEARLWWDANTRYARPSGAVESQFARWLEQNGNGKYDIYNGFEWFYQPDLTDLNATVDPVTGRTTVTVFHSGWGYDALWMRWSYWGNASYYKAVCLQGQRNPLTICDATLPYGAIQPEGWMPMESCWCEDAKIRGNISATGLDLNYEAVQAYHLQAWANWGADGFPGTPDDLPAWVFPAWLVDYVPRQGSDCPGSSAFPYSELTWYEGKTYIIGTPGSFSYGKPYCYTVAVTRWKLDAGSTLTIVVPRGEVPWYDPVRSTWDPVEQVGQYSAFGSTMTLRLVKADGQPVPPDPGTFYLWDVRGKVISIAGPHDWGRSDLPLDPTPWIEFAPETVG